jgi:hypothetical protein
MVFAVPMYLYVEANSPQEAQAIKEKIAKLLNQQTVSMILTSNRIPNKGFRIEDPVVAPST